MVFPHTAWPVHYCVMALPANQVPNRGVITPQQCGSAALPGGSVSGAGAAAGSTEVLRSAAQGRESRGKEMKQFNVDQWTLRSGLLLAVLRLSSVAICCGIVHASLDVTTCSA